MPGGSSTSQAEANQQGNQQQAEQYWQSLINQQTGNLKSYLAANPSPAAAWGKTGIKNPVGQTGTLGGGQAGPGGTVGKVNVPGGKPYDPHQTALMAALIGTGPRDGKGKAS